MHSQRYGTPRWYDTGRLRDSVVDSTPETLADKTATGFVFGADPDGFLLAGTARWPLPRQEGLAQLQKNGMARDFAGCQRSAIGLYEP
jgi:starch synthase